MHAAIATRGFLLPLAGALTIAAPAASQQQHDRPQMPRASDYLGLLPDGPDKRRFILDCTGCHQFDASMAFSNGAARSASDWEAIVAQMLDQAGPDSDFPIISAGRDPQQTARWLAAHLRSPNVWRRAAPNQAAPDSYALEEFPFPVPEDLPHDLAVDTAGHVVVTGMFTHAMWVLDPVLGEYSEVAIPVPEANPRALAIDSTGKWWVLLGNPKLAVRYDPSAGEWSQHDIGMYPHSVFPDAAGRVWFNGHFTKDPGLIGYVDGATGAVQTFGAPAAPGIAEGRSAIPYGLRVAPDGLVWSTELLGNRLLGLYPVTGGFTMFVFPTPHSGPRRLDVDSAGVVWIPEYANNRLAKFDPASSTFQESELPMADALPYVVRVDTDRNRVWIGTGAADAIVLFDPVSERFTVYPLESPGAVVRHLAIDPATGDVWVPYGASPGVPSRIVRLRLVESPQHPD